jgi:nitrogen fixation protein FixH
MINKAMPKRRASRDRWIPWAFVAFFATFIAVDAVMVVLAVSSFSGVSTENAYQEGLAYNRTLAEAQREKALGWRIDLAYAPSGPRQGRLIVGLMDRRGVPLSRATVSAELVRPTQEGLDFTVSLARDGESFAADLELPLAGQWEVRLVAARPDGAFHHRQRIIVP